MKTFSSRVNLIVLMLIFAFVSRADAHVFLDHADPRVGSQISKSPAEVKIWFTGDIEPAFSSIQVFSSDDKEVDKKNSHPDAKDKTLLIVSVPDLPAGVYKVVWQVVATDTHKTTGDFKFTVKP